LCLASQVSHALRYPLPALIKSISRSGIDSPVRATSLTI